MGFTDKITGCGKDGFVRFLGGADGSLSYWESIAKTVRSGRGAEKFNIGEQLNAPWTYNGTTYDAPQNICHFSDSEEFSDDNGETVMTGNGMVLQWNYAAPYSMPFDAPEALYAAPKGGLASGTYYFTVTSYNTAFNDKTYMFELTRDLIEGQQLVLQDIDTVRVYDSPYDNSHNTAYGDMVLSEWDGKSGKPLSGDASANSTDGKGTLNYGTRILNGSDRWSQSVMRQWLNSAASARNANNPENYPGWWSPQNRFDRIPSQAFTQPGFLYGYNDDFIAAMRPVKVITACNIVTDGGAADITYDKVFLPSLTQMNIAPQAEEGYTWDYYKELFAANPVEGCANWPTNEAYEVLKTNLIDTKTTAPMVRLRSVLRGNACLTWFISSTGFISGNTASNVYSMRPACVIG